MESERKGRLGSSRGKKKEMGKGGCNNSERKKNANERENNIGKFIFRSHSWPPLFVYLSCRAQTGISISVYTYRHRHTRVKKIRRYCIHEARKKFAPFGALLWFFADRALANKRKWSCGTLLVTDITLLINYAGKKAEWLRGDWEGRRDEKRTWAEKQTSFVKA